MRGVMQSSWCSGRFDHRPRPARRRACRASSGGSRRAMPAVIRTHSGSFRDRGAPGGARNGESVSISRRSSGTIAATSADASSPRRKTSPEKLIARPEIDDRPSVVERPGIRVDDGRRSVPEGRGPRRAADAGLHELRHERVLRVASTLGRAAVQDGGLAGRECEREVPAQVRQLVRDRAEDPVVIEPGLADRHDARIRRPSDDPIPPRVIDLGRVVRVDPDRGVEPRRTGRRRRAPAPTTQRSSLERGPAPLPPAARQPMTWSASDSNRSALRWQWLSMRRAGRPAFRTLRPRRRDAGTGAREPPRGRPRARGLPRRARRGPAARRSRQAHTGTGTRAARGAAAPSRAGTVRRPGRRGGTPR